MPIIVKGRYDYGQLRFYPVNEQAKSLAALTKTATFTMTMLRHAKGMGAVLTLVNKAEMAGVLTDLTLFVEE